MVGAVLRFTANLQVGPIEGECGLLIDPTFHCDFERRKEWYRTPL